MKTYYSIVSIATNPQLNEKFNIGLLCVTPEKTYFHFSEAKFKIISKLITLSASKLALAALNGMEKNINKIPTIEDKLFNNDNNYTVSEPYINYLSRYNNNLVQFSEATTIDLDICFDVFKVLFKKYIYSEEVFETIIKPKANLFTSVRKKFRKSAEQYANVNFAVSNEIIPDLIVPVTVDFFGKNGAFVSGQSIDFSKSFSSLQSDISSYLYLVEHTEKVDKEAKCYVLGDEPIKEDKQQHDLWKVICNSKLVEVVALDESEKIIDYMKEKGVAPIA
ncbi:MAG: hypothetical protein RL679_675 [Bacteroidota bacterium]|jgi:hypothetical protein